MKHLLVSLCAILLVLNSQAQIPNINDTEIDDYVKSYEALDIFSGVVLIAKNGEVEFQKAYGKANRITQRDNDLKTMFSLGSMNKTFTEVVILKLIEAGKLSKNDKLIKYLGKWPQNDFDKITISHLLNHESGFGDYFTREYWGLQQKSISNILEIIKKQELHFKPGKGEMYSNAGFVLLGAIIEKVTGKSYAENVAEMIVKPLGLNDIVLNHVSEIQNRAIGYMKTVDGVEDNEDFLHNPLPDGGFYATAKTVLEFYRAYFNDENFIATDTRKQSDFLNQIEEYRTVKNAAIPMAGGFNGSNSVIYQRLADDISIVVLANMDEPVAERIGLGLHYMISGKEAPKAILPAKLNVHKAYQENGLDYVKRHFEDLIENFHPTDPKDLILNGLGYDLLFSGKADEAIVFFKLNTELFPQVANCWDSLGEAYKEIGEFEKSKQAYKKALSLDSQLVSAINALKEME